jgi:hypothetical protein
MKQGRWLVKATNRPPISCALSMRAGLEFTAPANADIGLTADRQ